MHRRGDRVVPVRGGKVFADLVPNSVWLELDGDDHTPFTGDVPSVLGPMLNFFAGLPAEPAVQPAPVAILVATIDAPAGLDLRTECTLLRGREVATGVFAFDGLVRALSFATAAARVGARAGLHIGPVTSDPSSASLESVRTALAVAEGAPEGEARGTEIVRDIGHGVPFDLVRVGASIDAAGGPLELFRIRPR
jgi:hypothetical protein